MVDWGVDLAFTASQKAISVPPGLALAVARPAALAAFQARKTPVGSYYADWTNWLPIMEAYEARKPSYFGTPAVNLVWALNVSLGQILAEGMDARIARHVKLGRACQAGIAALGLGQVPLAPAIAAHTMTAPRFPAGVAGPDLLKHIGAAGVTLAGGLHPAIRAEYFRIGHMGPMTLNDVLAALGAIEHGLEGVRLRVHAGRRGGRSRSRVRRVGTHNRRAYLLNFPDLTCWGRSPDRVTPGTVGDRPQLPQTIEKIQMCFSCTGYQHARHATAVPKPSQAIIPHPVINPREGKEANIIIYAALARVRARRHPDAHAQATS